MEKLSEMPSLFTCYPGHSAVRENLSAVFGQNRSVDSDPERVGKGQCDACSVAQNAHRCDLAFLVGDYGTRLASSTQWAGVSNVTSVGSLVLTCWAISPAT